MLDLVSSLSQIPETHREGPIPSSPSLARPSFAVLGYRIFEGHGYAAAIALGTLVLGALATAYFFPASGSQ